MHRVFNCGIGMVIVVAAPHAKAAIDVLRAGGRNGMAGRDHRRTHRGRGADDRRVKKIVILISGRGSNMQAILEARLPLRGRGGDQQ